MDIGAHAVDGDGDGHILHRELVDCFHAEVFKGDYLGFLDCARDEGELAWLAAHDDDIAGARDAVKGKTEMDALVAYLQVLGTAIKNKR